MSHPASASPPFVLIGWRFERIWRLNWEGHNRAVCGGELTFTTAGAVARNNAAL